MPFSQEKNEVREHRRKRKEKKRRKRDRIAGGNRPAKLVSAKLEADKRKKY